MNTYDAIVNRILTETNVTEEILLKKIKAAQAWHNPMNYDNGEGIKEKYGWKTLFTDHIKGHRYYFKFHDYDLTDVDVCLNAFKNCDNYKKYLSIWKRHAPKGLRSELIYLLAITEMTTKGFTHEKNVVKRLQEQGHDVRISTPEEDLRGIDIWVDGIAQQIKSKATAYNMQGVLS